ncbi:MAG TPA: hypothetical protein VG722_03740, partial [Tepidisphaeraceae bacterium]|nr:hypothetical protein [Tepidisphaeraceae bacterium]
MNYAILWVDALIVCLLWVAFFASCISRLKRKWVRGVLLAVVFVIPLWALGSLVAASISMKFVGHFPHSWFLYFVTLLATFLLGTGLILYQARRRPVTIKPAAATWRPVPLGLALMIIAGVGYMALVNMDLAIRARCAVLSVKVMSVYQAAAPAITTESQNAAPLYNEAFAR